MEKDLCYFLLERIEGELSSCEDAVAEADLYLGTPWYYSRKFELSGDIESSFKEVKGSFEFFFKKFSYIYKDDVKEKRNELIIRYKKLRARALVHLHRLNDK